MSSESDNKNITLLSSNGDAFELDIAVAKQSEFLTHLIEDCGVDDAIRIPLANITSTIMVKVIEYCKKHVNHNFETDETEYEFKRWDANFINVDQETLFDIILAANFLNIKGLLDLGCTTVANMMKDKTPEEIRETFHIENDFSPAEEEEIRQSFQ